jgi:PII-like signaling protein
MKVETDAQMVTIFVNSNDQYEGKALYSAIVHKCQEQGIAGATVMRCVEGFGSGHHLHTTRLLDLSENLPVRIEIIDVRARIEPLLAALGDMIRQGLVAVSDVHILQFSPDAK